MRKFNVVELYAGIGRCSAPFHAWSAARVGLLADWNSHAGQTYKQNYPRVPYGIADLSNTSVDELEAAAGGKIHIVLGCPPCQGFSESGLRDPHDPRNNHVNNFIRLALGARPLAIAMENVPLAAVSPQFLRATSALENAGYRWTAGVLNAAEYGSAQTRHRLVLVAIRNDVGAEPMLPSPTHAPVGKYFDYRTGKLRSFNGPDADLLAITSSSRRGVAALQTRFAAATKLLPTPTFRDVTSGLPREGSADAAALAHTSWAHSPEMLRRMESVAEGGQLDTGKRYFQSAYARLHRRGLTRTLTTYFPNAGSGRFWHPTKNRAITVREAARIQGVPDSFRFQAGATQANAILLGNTLDARLASATYLSVRQALE